jgi:FimV-like protein
VNVRHAFKPWRLAAAVALTLPYAAGAADLGPLVVHSSLGEPLRAEIELKLVHEREAATLAARIATPEAFQRANLQYRDSVEALRTSIVKREDGRYYVTVTTPDAVRELFMDILLEVSWAGGQTVRPYTALIDPPGSGLGANGVASTTRASQTAVTARGATETAPSAAQGPSSEPEAPVSGQRRSTQYGPVKRGETLSKIARIVKYDETTLEQTMVGLHRHNPHAFMRNNMNLLRTGQILEVPETLILTSIPQRLAVREIRLQTADWESFQARLAQREAPSGNDVHAGRLNATGADSASVAAAPEAAQNPQPSLAQTVPSAAAQGSSSGLRMQGDALANSEAVGEETDRTAGTQAATPPHAAASAGAPPDVWMRPTSYLAAGGVLLLGGLGLFWARRRRTEGEAHSAARRLALAMGVHGGAAAAASSPIAVGEPTEASASTEEALLSPIETTDAPAAAEDATLVRIEAEATTAGGEIPIYNTLSGQGSEERANVASATSGNAPQSATASLIRAGAASYPLVPFIRQPASLDPLSSMAA